MAKRAKTVNGPFFDRPANRALRMFMSENGLTNEEASAALLEKSGRKITGQHIGNYKRGDAEVKLEFSRDWKTTFGVDLENINETKLSNEAEAKASETELFRDRIYNGDYVGMHKRAMDQLEETLATQRELLRQASDNNTRLVKSVAEMVAMITSIRAKRSKQT